MTDKPSAPVLPVVAYLTATGCLQWDVYGVEDEPLCKVSDALAAIEADRASQGDALDAARLDWLANNPLEALDIFGHAKAE